MSPGVDFPVNEGTPVHTTMAGKVVWAGPNGPWGNLVVVENNGYQVWFAHLSVISVSVGDILEYGDVVGLSGNTGNSTGYRLEGSPSMAAGTWNPVAGATFSPPA